ncbi:hypothetical protein GRI89_14605 [Altererythrobacter salegens]|uniref:Uncharacterized protein n=1 Tax=Croceibacterium salegens TaxID=1737568 RepID=A0A6I4SXP6_9SPHN|nr:hypothetical protein [Croceibacterium salegens]MXO60771.1 hypothetical protein [Croceibacterium salegens]
MELYGRIDEDGKFLLLLEGGGEEQCLLFTTEEDDTENEVEEFDTSDLDPGPVVVTCSGFDGDNAWGVTEVAADDEGDDPEDDADEEESEHNDEDASA